MNRRNVLTGLGGLAISGGALFGSGAFTSVNAERTVEVNVIAPEDVSNEDAADVIADEYVDVRVDAGGNDSVFVSTGSTSSENEMTDATSLDPTGNGNLSSDQVSLIANDVTLVFGSPNSGLLNNAETIYSELFTVENRDDDTSDDFNVELSLSSGSWLNIGGGDTVGGDSQGSSNLEPISAGNTETYDATVNTNNVENGGNGADDTDTLTITIKPTQ